MHLSTKPSLKRVNLSRDHMKNCVVGTSALIEDEFDRLRMYAQSFCDVLSPAKLKALGC